MLHAFKLQVQKDAAKKFLTLVFAILLSTLKHKMMNRQIQSEGVKQLETLSIEDS